MRHPLQFCDGLLVLVESRERQGAMDFKLRVASNFTWAPDELIRKLWAVRPTLTEHACTSDDVDGEEGPAGHAMTVPHLVEHLAIDLLVERRGADASGEPVAGYTVWLNRRHGLARVTLSSTDHATTEQALHDACRILEDAEGDSRPI